MHCRCLLQSNSVVAKLADKNFLTLILGNTFTHYICFHLSQSTIAPTYRPDPLEVHLLIVGVEMGLWLAEQAANDLRLVFPFLKVQVLSANKIIRCAFAYCWGGDRPVAC